MLKCNNSWNENQIAYNRFRRLDHYLTSFRIRNIRNDLKARIIDKSIKLLLTTCFIMNSMIETNTRKQSKVFNLSRK